MSEEKLKQYQHAMEIDQATGKPMPKMSIAGASDGGGALGVNVKQSEIVQPTDLQSRYSQTIQTHNAVSVGANTATTKVSIATKGYSKGVVTLDATGNASLYVNIVLINGNSLNSSVARIVNDESAFNRKLKFFDLNGIEKIEVFALDTSGATNAITIEVSLIV